MVSEEEVHPDEGEGAGGGQQTDAGKPGCIAPHAPAQVRILVEFREGSMHSEHGFTYQLRCYLVL